MACGGGGIVGLQRFINEGGEKGGRGRGGEKGPLAFFSRRLKQVDINDSENISSPWHHPDENRKQ
jgi:hypothetical protein